MGLRNLAKRILGVERRPAYCLPWLTRPHLQCALVKIYHLCVWCAALGR